MRRNNESGFESSLTVWRSAPPARSETHALKAQRGVEVRLAMRGNKLATHSTFPIGIRAHSGPTLVPRSHFGCAGNDSTRRDTKVMAARGEIELLKQSLQRHFLMNTQPASRFHRDSSTARGRGTR
jgi:hypothetical protein